MMVRSAWRALLLVIIWLAAAGSVYSQQSASLASAGTEVGQKAVSYTFVSPNTRENLTLQDAIKLLNSPEELQFINAIHRLTGCLRLKPLVMKTIGSSTDGAEHSALFRVYTDQATLRYADARLGKMGRQKTVLNFREDCSGASRMYVLRVWMGKRTLASVSRTLDLEGIAFRTLVPRMRQRLFIYVVDLNDELNNKIIRAAHRLGALMAIIRGTGEFIGDDTDREKAQQVFAEEIRKFEDGNPHVARRCARQ
jgi:hypothetical protein